jgi:hypothetical protein
MTQTFGKFIERQEEYGEYLKIGFSPTSIPLQQRWRNNGLSADFLADYLCTFFPGEDGASTERQAEIKGAVSYIANELLENAMKFSYAPSQHAISLTMYLEADAISLYVTNSVDPKSLVAFQQCIQRLLTEDPHDLYMEQLTGNAEAENGGACGLGILTMLNDYGATVAWQFAPMVPEADVMAVTTMVRVPV